MAESALQFRPDPYAGPAFAHAAAAPMGPVESQRGLHVRSLRRLDEVEVSVCEAALHLAFRITTAEARALAVELVTAANASDLAKGVLHG